MVRDVEEAPARKKSDWLALGVLLWSLANCCIAARVTSFRLPPASPLRYASAESSVQLGNLVEDSSYDLNPRVRIA